jgi:hypothetical protein
MAGPEAQAPEHEKLWTTSAVRRLRFTTSGVTVAPASEGLIEYDPAGTRKM